MSDKLQFVRRLAIETRNSKRQTEVYRTLKLPACDKTQSLKVQEEHSRGG